MKKIFWGLALLVLTGCAPTMLQAVDYDDFRNQALAKGFKFTAESYSETTQMSRGGMGAGNTQPRANQIALEQCAKVSSNCIITRENNDVVKTTWWQQWQQTVTENKNTDDANNVKVYNEKITETPKSTKKKEDQTESKFSKKCQGGIFTSGFKKGTTEFDECIKKEEKLAALEEQKQKLLNEEKDKKFALMEEKKKKLIEDKKKLDAVKEKEESNKLSTMSADDRRAYICNEKYGFRKGSDNFKDCIFKIYSAEIELEKLELQKQLAKANADLAKVNAASREKLANAQTNAAIMQAYAAQQQAIAANTADSLALMESGLRMMSPQRPAPRMQTTCTYTGRFMNCF
jgi:hypothetical protein